MNREKTNILIAEFMGVVGEKPLGYTHDIWKIPLKDVYSNLSEEDEFTEVGYFTAKELKYHNSWDWIIPVISRILPMGSFSIAFGEKQSEVVMSLKTSRIKPVYRAVIDFINFFNDSLPKKA
jgi:hypothetical protein